jgi:UDP-glucose 4-epimerase
MRILITGGCGFIGSHLVSSYAAAGHTVGVVDLVTKGKLGEFPAGVVVYQGDICEQQWLEGVCREFRPGLVSHHAAQTSVAVSARQPGQDARVNIQGLISVVKASQASGAGILHFASSAGTVYGSVMHASTEDAPLRPESPYGLSKATGEAYLALLTKGTEMAVTIFRYANVYGPGQDPHGESGVTAIFCQHMIEQKPVAIFGGGDQVRDYIYIDDVVGANQRAANQSQPGVAIYNIASEESVTTNRVYRTLSDLFGYTLRAQQLPWREGDVATVLLSSNKARKAGLLSNLRSFDQGCQELVRWYKEREV